MNPEDFKYFIFNKGLAMGSECELAFIAESLSDTEMQEFAKRNFHDAGNCTYMKVYKGFSPL